MKQRAKWEFLHSFQSANNRSVYNCHEIWSKSNSKDRKLDEKDGSGETV